MAEQTSVAPVPRRIDAQALREPGEGQLLRKTIVLLGCVYLFAIGATLTVFLGWFLVAILTVRVLRSRYLAEAIEIGDDQLPELSALLRRCASQLDAPAPRLFITVDPGASPIFTVPVPEPAILLHAHWVKILTEEELTFFLCHEIAHGQLGHRRLLNPINVLENVGAISWILTTPLEVMRYALRPWSRLADFSADRVALACVGGRVEVVASALAKVTAGEELFGEVSVPGFIRQARRLSESRILTFHEIVTGRLGAARRLSRLINFSTAPNFDALCEPKARPERYGLLKRLVGRSRVADVDASTGSLPPTP